MSGRTEGSDRRSAQRFDFGIEVVVVRGDETFRYLSKNISVGGMKLAWGEERKLELGDAVKMSFNLPLLSAPVEVEGEVRWVGEDDCGIQFSGLSPRIVSTINRLQWRR